jgi:myo-inositol 2-dehydrogenase / D-chiro-inositol 1-dehydrogenase
MTTPTDINIGFIGCGRNARGHMRSLAGVPGARIVGVCDVVPDLAQQAASETGAEAYTDFHALLRRDDLQAVYVSIPVFAHGEPELAIVERGLPLFVEKPVAIDMATARRVEKAISDAGLISCVGYQLRYRGSAEVARQLLSEEGAGTTGILHGAYWCGTGRQLGGTWRTQMSGSGGQILEQATHVLDMMRFLTGEIDEVFAFVSRAILAEDYGDSPDVHAVSLKFAGGAVGTLSATWALDPSDWTQANVIQIGYGEKRLFWKIDALAVTANQQSEEPQLPPDGNIDAVFVDAVRTGDSSKIRSDYAEGVRSLAVCLAINESAKTGRPVQVASM